MKTALQYIQISTSSFHLSRNWQTCTLIIGCIVILILLLMINQPAMTIATGGCSAPDGVCSYIISS